MNDGPGRPFGSAHDAALRQITAPKRSREEYVDSEVWCDAIAEPDPVESCVPCEPLRLKIPLSKLNSRCELTGVA